MIDGIEVNDPGSPNRTFNFANLAIENIDRIEVIRGSQSTLYGSDAIGGVINIITKTGSEKPEFSISTEAGSYETYTERVEGRTNFNGGNISMGLYRQDSSSISAAGSRYGNTEHDSYNNTSGSARLQLKPSEIADFDFVIRAIDSNAELDNQGGIGGDDIDRLLDTELLATKAESTLNLFEGLLEQTYRISYSTSQRDDNSDPDAVSSELLRSHYEGSLMQVDWQNALYLNSTQTFLFGLEWQEEEASSRYFSSGIYGDYESNLDEVDATNKAWYFQDQIDLGLLHATAGLRVDDHSQFGSKLTWKVAPALVFTSTGTTIRSSVGTGFKAPSLGQLYADYGNKELKAEESLSIDAGIEQSFCQGDYTIGATYFWNKFDNLIQLDASSFTLENIAEARSKGVEFFASARITEELRSSLSFTYTDSEDKQNKDLLLRRPKTKFVFSSNYQFTEQLSGDLEVLFTGHREDNNYSTYPTTRSKLSQYTLVNLVVNYDLTKSLRLYARVDNLGDEYYEPVLGFGSTGLAGYGGIQISL